MKKIIFWVGFLTLMLFASISFAASSCYQDLLCKGNACILRLSWTTSATGTFTAFTTMEVNGYIDGVQTDPSDSAVPSDNYDINIANKVVSDINGTSTTTTRNIDGDSGTWTAGEVTTGQDGVLANRDTATTEFTRFYTNNNYGGITNIGPLIVDISNAGNSKSGVIDIYFYRTK